MPIQTLFPGTFFKIPSLQFYNNSVTPAQFTATVYFKPGGGPMTINYGDGTIDSIASGSVAHTYASSGTKFVRMTSTTLNKLYYFDVQFGANVSSLPSFAVCTLLETLYCNNNQFTGALPSFATNAKLKNLFISDNQFSGGLPSFEACTALQSISVADNNFSGEIPSFASCTALTTFYAAHNQFSGTLPSFSACTGLVDFSCAANPLTGTLPSFEACTKLAYFHAGACDFSGTMPSFATCPNLSVCDLNKANFSGALPSFAANTKLKNFWCNLNQLSGTIPSFADCTMLETWHGDSNQFTDYIAGSFATQGKLAELHLNINRLPQSAIDAILADLVTSLNISGRVTCEVNLSGAGNAAPSNPTGLANKATLVAAWGTGKVLTN